MSARFQRRHWIFAGPLPLSIALVLASACALFSLEYEDNKAFVRHLKDLASDHKKILRVERVAETPGKNELWRAELGAGSDEERKQRPAMLVVAGIEGNDLAGSVSAVAWME